MKKFYFLGGLPRSGSTLLCNILLQNPEIYASATSGILDVLIPIKNGWNKIPGFRAMQAAESQTRLRDTLRGCFYGTYESYLHPVIIDKSRGWLRHIATIEEITGEKAKILVTVRDLRQVLSSLEKLYRRTSALGVTSQEIAAPKEFVNVESRCAFWAKGDQLLGAALNAIRYAIELDQLDRLHFVDFKDLTKAPKSTLEGIYNFLELEPFEHDFENVAQKTIEDDRVHGWEGLHNIRPKVEYVNPDYRDILGEKLAAKFAGQELW